MSGKSGKLNSFQMTFYTGPIAFATLASGGDLGKFWGDSGEILGRFWGALAICEALR